MAVLLVGGCCLLSVACVFPRSRLFVVCCRVMAAVALSVMVCCLLCDECCCFWCSLFDVCCLLFVNYCLLRVRVWVY